MNKVILFGASRAGVEFYEKNKDKFNVLAFCDNNNTKWGKSIEDIKIVSPMELLNYKETLIIITSMYYKEIEIQLEGLGVYNYINYLYFAEYSLNNLVSDKLYYYKTSKDEIIINNKNVLFINYDKEDNVNLKFIRDRALEGFKICFSQIKNNLEFCYESKTYKFNSIDELINFVNNLNYSIITLTDKSREVINDISKIQSKIVFYYDNSKSIRESIFDNEIVHSFIDYKLNVYKPEKVHENHFLCSEFCETKDSMILNINNYTMNSNSKVKLQKFSFIDNEFHCVYCGTLSKEKDQFDYLEEKFLKLAKKNIHIHFYTEDEDLDYFKKMQSMNEYLHWEGTFDVKNIDELTKYDFGLIFINVNENNRLFCSSLIPKNIFYYINAEIPIVTEMYNIEIEKADSLYYGKKIDTQIITGGIENLNNFIVYNGLGNFINLNAEQNLFINKLKYICKMTYKRNKIIKDFNYILNFYNQVFNDGTIINYQDNKEITILIPTKNRSSYLKRCITYFQTMNDKNFNVKIIVLDSSDKLEEKLKVKNFIKNNKFENIEYFEFREENGYIFYDKINFGLNKVKTKYLCLCADDDFILKYSLIESMNIMERYSDISTVIGTQLIFSENNFSNINCCDYMKNFRNISEKDIFDRLNYYIKDQLYGFLYNVYRVEEFKAIIGNILDYKLENGSFQEMLLYLDTVTNGEIKVFNKKLNLRDGSTTSQEFIKKNFEYKISDGSFNDYYSELKSVFKNYLNMKKYIVKDDTTLDNNIDKVFSLYLENPIAYGIQKKFISICDGKFDLNLLMQGLNSRRL